MNLARIFQNRLVLALVVGVLCIALDQATKEVARRYLPGTGQHSYLADTFRLEFALNTGGFLSLGGQLSPAVRIAIFIVFNALAMALLTVFLIIKRDAPLIVFLSMVLIIAGGLGNLIDRVIDNGRVTDFMNMGIGPIRTGIFNVADIAVTVGTVIVFVWLFRTPRPISLRGESLGGEAPGALRGVPPQAGSESK
jgi:signal peptidase II